jgi:predicted transcriptional regulator of viral defense system
VTVRDELRAVALEQYGYVTTADARRLGVPVVELAKAAGRKWLEHVSQGVYRFADWPSSAEDPYMEAVLWTRDPRVALSHETALSVYELSDINPDKIHVTIPARAKPLRRQAMPRALAVHYENLDTDQIGWWQGIPTVTVPTAIDQCIQVGVRPDLVEQAITAARRQGRVDAATARRQRLALRAVGRINA